MSEQASGASRSRSVGFPVLELREAVEGVYRAGKHGHTHKESAFADYLGHTSVNSGAFRAKLAALRDWGLIESRSKDQVILTPLAQDLALTDDPLREYPLLQQAFHASRLMEAVYDQLGRGTPLPLERVAKQAVMRHSINASQQQRFAEVFVSSAVTCGLARRDGSMVTLEAAHEPEAVAPSAEASQVNDDSSRSRGEPRRLERQTALINQHWRAGTGRVVLQIFGDGALPAGVFKELGTAVQSLEALAAALDDADATATS